MYNFISAIVAAWILECFSKLLIDGLLLLYAEQDLTRGELEVYGLEKNIVSIEDRIPKLKQMRKKKANRRLIGLLTIFFLLIFSIIYFQSPISKIQAIKVEGNSYLTDKEIVQASGIKLEENFWEVKKDQATSAIKKEKEVSSAKISRQLPNTIVITVDEYEYTAYVQEGKDYYPVLANGTILKKKLRVIPDSGPLLVSFKEGKALQTVIEQLDNLPPEIMNSISEIHYNPTESAPYKITLYMNDGYEVTASGETLAKKMAHYPAIVSQLSEEDKGVIDLEVGSYFRAYETDTEEEGASEQQE